jgi:hypothetical protein
MPDQTQPTEFDPGPVPELDDEQLAAMEAANAAEALKNYQPPTVEAE